jgi:hypothetical protein
MYTNLLDHMTKRFFLHDKQVLQNIFKYIPLSYKLILHINDYCILTILTTTYILIYSLQKEQVKLNDTRSKCFYISNPLFFLEYTNILYTWKHAIWLG